MKVLYFAFFTVLMLGLSVGAFAKDSHSGSLMLENPVQVGSTQLAPGNYKVEWNGPNDNVQVQIMQHGKTVATAQGKIKDLQRRSAYDAVVTSATPNHAKELNEIDFSNQKEALVLQGE